MPERVKPGTVSAGTVPGHPRVVVAVVAVVAVAATVASLMQTLVVPLLARLPGLLHTQEADAAWAVTVTLPAGAVAMPVMGRLGDMYGRRRLLAACLMVLTAGRC